MQATGGCNLFLLGCQHLFGAGAAMFPFLPSTSSTIKGLFAT
jgi:hypothetical protein